MDYKTTRTLFVVIFASVLPAVQPCPDYWMSYKGSCYALIRNQSPWAYADEMCRDMDGYLVEINTPEENNFIKSLIRNSGVSATRYWLGGQDLLKEGEWGWINSGTLLEYTDWQPGNPSNSHGQENCMEMLSDNNFHWNDNDCKEALNFICERDLPQGPVIG